MFEETRRKRWLLDGYRVVAWANLDVDDVQISSLLTLYCVCSFVETAQLHSHVLAMHVHSYFEIHSGGDIHSEVVRL